EEGAARGPHSAEGGAWREEDRIMPDEPEPEVRADVSDGKAQVGEHRLEERSGTRQRRPLPDDAEEAQLLAYVAAVPAQVHLGELPVGGRDDGVDHRRSLVERVPAAVEQV